MFKEHQKIWPRFLIVLLKFLEEAVRSQQGLYSGFKGCAGDDRMGAKIKTQKHPYRASKKIKP